MRPLLLGTCRGCGTKCDSRAERCAECRWAHQRSSQGPRRFWAKVDGDGECWLWTGYLMHKDYGQYRSPEGQTILAHRMAWILTYGEIPDELCVLHVCDEPRCVRPDHLWLGTKADNNRDMAAKGRHHAQKATPDLLADMRRLRAEGVRVAEIAERFGFSESRTYVLTRSAA